ncbi:RNA polymerase sigma factor [Eilatimonas milleporae]|uniref:RNA polymerase sigma-70 factor (ECF subfamily) n=1 Tax=Eilatimonas milleporae TaxID=911205 RepID=A0A3M0D7H2_9PROT|nr:sigma-70 family RNA polymerase sigma factor [Eilatimonas milleporae]RMB12213.1 RNA polymerase sigma-70 factor (ECF subfamily) [Eilatimonas milleporae]
MTQIPKKIKAGDSEGKALALPMGQDQSFAAFYEQVAEELVKGLKKRFGNGPPEPQDLAHEAFRRVFEYPGFSDVDNKRAFLWRTALNLAAIERRKMDVRTRKEPDVLDTFFSDKGDIPTPESILCMREQLGAIRVLVEAMPTRRRLVLLMRRVEGLTQKDIARRLGISRSSVIKHLARADQQLNELLLSDED